ncbi:MAG: bifunctional riboflavin kinase/FAD synthetase [Endomicrobiaceae bacterium]|mgnify:CR=1 FL=1|jgi:riboflavin kinase/FMN adenylyltransferase|nr:bifunctional riboflavin kinase/FAD synthetase [Endomicrobiaceae bacterium]MDD3730116.1 bifunctional riboflavin kinase/FAD synthetase [Endomicrobiaceae bacterium]MDD4165626.1 bifunctional riboflavin kinase/FAD synthetase [Endomicrobiaceae bacterium]
MKGSVITIGTFDGVHLGHKAILDKVVKTAKAYNLQSIVITMEKPVKKVDGLLTLPNEKIEIISSFGIDKIVVFPVNKTVLNTTAADFFKNIIVKQLKAKYLVVGYNCAFGKDREGDIAWLKEAVKKYGIKLKVVSQVKNGGYIVSSSKIRDLINKNKISLANKTSGRIFEINGVHVSGNKIGRTIGFPTINVKVCKEKILPKGIFTCSVFDAYGKCYPAVLNIGTRPTFRKLSHSLSVEVHILNFSGKWKTKNIKILVHEFIRNEKKFANIESLQRAIRKDIAFASDKKVCKLT